MFLLCWVCERVSLGVLVNMCECTSAMYKGESQQVCSYRLDWPDLGYVTCWLSNFRQLAGTLWITVSSSEKRE